MKVCILGVARSGTTALYCLLQEILAGSREPCEFVYEPFLWHPEVFNGRYDEVSRNFRHIASLSHLGIHTHLGLPMFILQPQAQAGDPYLREVLRADAPERHVLAKMIRANGRALLLNEICPECRFIFILRNPLDNVHSVLNQFSFYGFEFHRDDFPRFRREAESIFQTHLAVDERSPACAREVAYWEYMNRFFLENSTALKDRLLLLSHEALCQDQEHTVRAVCRFLDLPFETRFLETVNRKPGATTPRHELTPEEMDVLFPHLERYPEWLSRFGIPGQACPAQIAAKYRLAPVERDRFRELYGLNPVHVKQRVTRMMSGCRAPEMAPENGPPPHPETVPEPRGSSAAGIPSRRGESPEMPTRGTNRMLSPFRRSWERTIARAKGQNSITLGVFEGDMREYGHDLYFTQHVLRLLSPIFRRIVFFDCDGRLARSCPRLPANVSITEVPAEVRGGESPSFQPVWRFIREHGCDLLLFSSERVLYKSSSPFPIPDLPFMFCVHIAWQLRQKMEEDPAIVAAIREAQTIFLLEDYLKDHFRQINTRLCRFPYFAFADGFRVARKRCRPPIRVATIGVINDRRNVDFILRTLATYQGPPLAYTLAGKPLGRIGERVSTLLEQLAFPPSVSFTPRLDYLSEPDFHSTIAASDFILVAYDETRSEQTPGIIYLAASHNTVLIAPRVEPFTFYERAFPGMIVFYDPLSGPSLKKLLARLAAGGKATDTLLKEAQTSRRLFVSLNQASRQRKQIRRYLRREALRTRWQEEFARVRQRLARMLNWKARWTALLYGSLYNRSNATEKYADRWGKAKSWLRITRARLAWRWRDAPRLRALKNIHAGRRGFIIGNGPSINEMNLAPLRDEITFGVNGIYLNFGRMGFQPTYYVVEDNLVAEDRGAEIERLRGMTKFYAMRLAYCLTPDRETVFLNHNPGGNLWQDLHRQYGLKGKFSPDASRVTYGGNTVLYTCLQLAFHLGIREVYLIGCDHNLVVPKGYEGRSPDENFVIESVHDDVNHFHPDYFGRGFRWHNPKLHMIEASFKTAKKFFEIHGGMILNATRGGKLEVFDRAEFEALFEPGYRNSVYENRKRLHDRLTALAPASPPRGRVHCDGRVSRSGSLADTGRQPFPYAIAFRLHSNGRRIKPAYTQTAPPTPLTIPPLSVYQVGPNAFRFYLDETFDCVVPFPKPAWYDIRLEADPVGPRTALSINGALVAESPAFAPLKGIYTVGRGAKRRFWKGELGDIRVMRSSAPPTVLLELPDDLTSEPPPATPRGRRSA